MAEKRMISGLVAVELGMGERKADNELAATELPFLPESAKLMRTRCGGVAVFAGNVT